ncbi:MAG: hybrid sensor histidine kinase/response regulator [Nitrospirae bacterium]|nr:hybrid sensor histidine kinase/response regulator [Nitrospirota bacterium]
MEEDFFYEETTIEDSLINPGEKWKVMIVDDDEEVHKVTILALRNMVIKDRGLHFIHAYTAKEAIGLITQHPDTSLILLDVVMETEYAGLLVVDFIRNELKNSSVRIVLRTGQPGQAPEVEIIKKYDINDYKEKSELTTQKLFTTLYSSISTYNDIVTIEKYKNHLESLVQQRTHMLIEKTEALEDLNRNLEVKVKEEIEKRMYSERMLIQKSRLASMGEMLSVIAHQWKQPLNGMYLLIQDIEDALDFGQIDRNYIANYVSEGKNYIHFLDRTVNDFRDFLKVGKKRDLFDVANAVKEVLGLLSGLLKNLQIEVSFDIHEGESYITDGYENEFKHVVLNLINNSRDAIIQRNKKETDDNKTKGLIEIRIIGAGSRIMVTITDNGCGIPEDIADKIFEPYFTTKDDETGTGIGLYLSKIIIEKNMGGRLYVTNPGNGVSFTIELVAEHSNTTEGKKNTG